MGDLSKLKIAIGQVRIVEGRPSTNEASCDAMIERAVDAGADALVVPNSLNDENDVRIIGLNDSRIDVAGDVVVLDAGGETYRIGMGRDVPDCDFRISADLSPYTIVRAKRKMGGPRIVLRPVGIRDAGKKVLCFDGRSRVINSQDKAILELRDDFQEDFALVDFARDASVDKAGTSSQKLLDALVTSVRRFDEQVLPFGPKWVIGLSGGLDSSVTAALLVLALGKERVVGYNMATRYNSDATKSNAQQLATALGIPLKNGSIEDMVVSLGNTLVQYGYGEDVLKGLVLENVQARARGNLLSAFAAVEGGVIANNGNRVECALGYATLYGDAIGAFAPIADLTKVQLFAVSRMINERFGFEVVPVNLLPTETEAGFEWKTMPSAELSNGQVDPMKWFYHDWLVSTLLGDGLERAKPLYEAACDVMQHYLDTRLLDTEVGRWVRLYGLDGDASAFAQDLSWVVSSMQRAAFKRIQAPPALIIASQASVSSWDETQTVPEAPSRYNALMRALASAS